MSEAPTDFDAILESIRTRVTGEVAATVVPPVAELPAKAKKLLPTPLVDASGTTVEALFTALLEPMLRQWIDANLPEICERIAQAEIRRLTGQP
jgi:cell pole-organizing protein PopZ